MRRVNIPDELSYCQEEWLVSLNLTDPNVPEIYLLAIINESNVEEWFQRKSDFFLYMQVYIVEEQRNEEI